MAVNSPFLVEKSSHFFSLFSPLQKEIQNEDQDVFSFEIFTLTDGQTEILFLFYSLARNVLYKQEPMAFSYTFHCRKTTVHVDSSFLHTFLWFFISV